MDRIRTSNSCQNQNEGTWKNAFHKGNQRQDKAQKRGDNLMVNTYTETQLVNVEWKPCSTCKKTGLGYEMMVCAHCNSTEVEPVEMENPAINYEDDKQGNQVMIRKHQVGESFAVSKGSEHIKLEDTQTFLPICQKVNGDNSVLMVVSLG